MTCMACNHDEDVHGPSGCLVRSDPIYGGRRCKCLVFAREVDWFWCSHHNAAHRDSHLDRECLLVGPFATPDEAIAWPS